MPPRARRGPHRPVGASLNQAADIYRGAALPALVHEAEKYGRNGEGMRLLLAEMGTVWIPGSAASLPAGAAFRCPPPASAGTASRR